MNDILAVAWKEWRELLGQRGFRGKSGLALFLVTFGVVLPLQTGPSWITSPVIELAWAWVPMFLVSTLISDAIAGERERHTLETLLASRLPDTAILFGKMAAAVGYACVMTAASAVLAEVAINIAYADRGFVTYVPRTLFATATIGLLGAVFVAAIGVLISLRAATVRQAQQVLSGTIVGLLLLPVVAVRLLPAAWRRSALASVPTLAQAAIVGFALLAAADAAIIAIVVRRFRRDRLVAA